ncbi:acetyl-CoA carboxylase biotin carboxyl carrier protein subunit [Parabacteroides distasonis]|uniref:acetyl-CoA carboxylase biotin carboxyl carrier protein subunit n=1 Tax=Parabacteroides distasonis TaxID=823 RepID=UPI0030CFBD24
MILRIASSRIVGQGDIVGRSGYFSLNLSANSVMRGRLDARRTLKSLVADLRVNMFYRSYHVDIVDTQKKYLRMRKSAEEKQDDKIVAPMPGKVVKIPVRKGDRLETGDTVVVLEAMKMQSNYKVSSACVVKDILVSEGDSVDNNQVLMTLDLLKDDSYE